jgi:hypothetical protein
MYLGVKRHYLPKDFNMFEEITTPMQSLMREEMTQLGHRGPVQQKVLREVSKAVEAYLASGNKYQNLSDIRDAKAEELRAAVDRKFDNIELNLLNRRLRRTYREYWDERKRLEDCYDVITVLIKPLTKNGEFIDKFWDLVERIDD